MPAGADMATNTAPPAETAPAPDTAGTAAETPTAPDTATDTTPAPEPKKVPRARPALSTVACGTAHNGFFRDITATGVNCPTATRTAEAWLSKVQSGSGPGATVTAGDFVCRSKVDGERADVRCEGKSDPAPRVRFKASP
jgi:hypothetical protein